MPWWDYWHKPLIHVRTKVKKYWEDITADDKPIDYGQKNCWVCTQAGTPGEHFVKFHEQLEEAYIKPLSRGIS